MNRPQLFLAGLLFAWAIGSADAADYLWLPTSGARSFHDADNWSPSGGPPNDANDAAIFSGAGAFTVVFDGDVQHDRLVARSTGGEISLDLDGHNYNLGGVSSDSLVVGESLGENAIVALHNGALRTAGSAVVAGEVGSAGQLAVDAGGIFDHSGRFSVGRFGDGQLFVQNGGQVTSNSSITWGEYTTGRGLAHVIGQNSAITTSANMFVGNHGQGELQVSSAGRIGANALFVGLQTNGHGEASVTGAASRIDLAGQLSIGQEGSGEITLSAGGQLTSTSGQLASFGGVAGNGKATITGAGSRWINAQSIDVATFSGLGQIDVLAGGRLDAGSTSLLVASEGAGTGTIVVDGAGSLIAQSFAATATLGREAGGSATLDITNGGRFETGLGQFRVNRTGAVRVRSGGELRLNGSLLIDSGLVEFDGGVAEFAPSAQVIVQEDGRLLTSGNFALPANGVVELHHGFAKLTAAGTVFNTAGSTLDLHGGKVVAPAVIVAEGGALNGHGIVDAEVLVADTFSSIAARDGILTLGKSDSSEGFINRGALDVGGAQVELLDQDLADLGDTSLSGGILTAVQGARLSALDSLTGYGTVRAAVTSAGLVSPGPGAELLRIDDDYTQSLAGRLRIELAGPNAVDQLRVTGLANLAGPLDVATIGGFIPQAGQEFTFLTYAARSGAFAAAVDDSPIPGLAWTIHYEATRAYLTLADRLPGDADRNGQVDALDYQSWLTHYNQCDVDWSMGDFDGDGCATGSDYSIWADHVSGRGATLPSAVTTAIPEPASVMLVVHGAAMLLALAMWSLTRRIQKVARDETTRF